MTISQCAKDYFLSKDMNCAESVLRAANDCYNMGLDESALKLSGGFGAGLYCGHTCGAICGGVMALSKLYNVDRAHKSPSLSKATASFMKQCSEQLEHFECRELKPIYRKDNTIKCADLVAKVAEILDKVVYEQQ